MNRYIATLLTLAGITVSAFAANDDLSSHRNYQVVANDIFYDGYNTKEILDADRNDGVIRHTNYLHEYPLDLNTLTDIDSNLKLEVEIGARCDNYDRMGRVMLVFKPKGEDATGTGENADRIELARFITPFMNMNRQPNTVPYIYELNDLSYLFNDRSLRDNYDFALQVEVFGIPYAANQQIIGCANRQDVFAVNASFSWDSNADVALPDSKPSSVAAPASSVASLIPIYTSKTEIHGNVNFNNYKEVATDTLGVATRTFDFEVDKDLQYSRLMLILTNHGAAVNGEEYIRRTHLVYVDGQLVHSFIPGGVSCEPYRVYNTQRNGIYMDTPQDDWEEWNNWCPGQAVPIRRIDLGLLKQGHHKVMIRVPGAEFYGQDGDFRPSLYLHGRTDSDFAETGINTVQADDRLAVTLTRQGDNLLFETTEEIAELALYSIDGYLLEGLYNPGNSYSISDYAQGQYILMLIGRSGKYESFKLIK